MAVKLVETVRTMSYMWTNKQIIILFTFYYRYSITHSLFHSRLETFLFCKSFPPQPFLLFFRIHYTDPPDCLLLLLSIFRLLLFSFSVLQFLVVVSGFRAHVKIASRKKRSLCAPAADAGKARSPSDVRRVGGTTSDTDLRDALLAHYFCNGLVFVCVSVSPSVTDGRRIEIRFRHRGFL